MKHKKLRLAAKVGRQTTRAAITLQQFAVCFFLLLLAYALQVSKPLL